MVPPSQVKGNEKAKASTSDSTSPVGGAASSSKEDESRHDEKKTEDDCDNTEFNSIAFTECFYGKETSFSLKVGCNDQNYARKRFDHGPHFCFLDLEALSKLPKLLNYFVLSAIALAHEKRVIYSTCYIEHKALKKRYLLLAILRSKCIGVRYDFVICDEEDGNCVSLLVGISKINPYVFLPDVKVDLTTARETLRSYLCDPSNRLALIEGHPNKDEYGHLVGSDDVDPLQMGLAGNSAGARTRKATEFFGEGQTIPPKTKAEKRKRGLRNPKGGAKKPRKVYIMVIFL